MRPVDSYCQRVFLFDWVSTYDDGFHRFFSASLACYFIQGGFILSVAVWDAMHTAAVGIF
jgi:hypothetical protein